MSKKRKSKSISRKTPVKRIKKSMEPKIGTYLGLEYESFCELSLLYFAEELMRLGFVKKVERSPSYSLCEPVISSYAVQLKKASKQETQTITRGVTYTPDFDIYFTDKAMGMFCWDLGSGIKLDKGLLVTQQVNSPEGILHKACCEVKPDFQRNDSTPKSVITMKWLYQKHRVLVNLFRPNRMFEGLFVPEKYRLTERGTPRLLKFKAKNLQQYLNSKK